MLFKIVKVKAFVVLDSRDTNHPRFMNKLSISFKRLKEVSELR